MSDERLIMRALLTAAALDVMTWRDGPALRPKPAKKPRSERLKRKAVKQSRRKNR